MQVQNRPAKGPYPEPKACPGCEEVGERNQVDPRYTRCKNDDCRVRLYV